MEEAADAASQSLARFFLNERLTEEQVGDVLGGLSTLGDKLALDDVSNPNVTPEAVVVRLLPELPCPEAVRQASHDAVYRLALHSAVQVLMLVGPVMAEWRKLTFSTTYELPRRVVNRLNQIAQQMDALGQSGQEAADERYELTYRDYLLQRFHLVEAGTVRMTTNMAVDLRELFVMPRVLARPPLAQGSQAEGTGDGGLMNLSAARALFAGHGGLDRRAAPEKEEQNGIAALDQVRRYPRNVVVGVPGSGKSTLFEWLQVKLASVEEEMVMADRQAIPLLLRVRQLDPRGLPHGDALVEKATASRDIAALMPEGWLDRQMQQGRVLLMLDGLDETEPELRDRHLLPWLKELCKRYKRCRYLVSSRPVGYAPGDMRVLEFNECDLLDFQPGAVLEYARHWCTAVRLARNEPEEEARREGAADGDTIVRGFEGHPYIANLARNPLMLSAICLVNYFEGGHLPQDRALLYKLCVEGLLHHWDQRRSIRSEFGFDEKLRVCREVALAMQADDRAECEAAGVQATFEAVLDNQTRARRLLEHVRYRTGLLLERRAGVFAFAHLTFQEYLAARAVHEGNRLGVDPERLVAQHEDGRWREVIALYCGLAPAPAARRVIEGLIAQQVTARVGQVLADAYLSSGPELAQDRALRRRVLERLAVAPTLHPSALERFPSSEAAPVANALLGSMESERDISEAYLWLVNNPEQIAWDFIVPRLREWRELHPAPMAELVHLVHRHGPDVLLSELARDADMYAAPGPQFPGVDYDSQAEVAFAALKSRGPEDWAEVPAGFGAALLRVLRQLSQQADLSRSPLYFIVLPDFTRAPPRAPEPEEVETWLTLASLARRLANRIAALDTPQGRLPSETGRTISRLNSWAAWLDRAVAESKR